MTNTPNILTAGSSLKAPLAMVFRRSDVCAEPSDEEKYAVWEEKTGRNADLGAAPSTNRRIDDENWAPEERCKDETNFRRRSFFYDAFERTPPTPGVDYSAWRPVAKGRNRLALPTDFVGPDGRAVGVDEISARLDLFFKSIDSVEPFERIRLAIEEAQKSG